MTITAFTNNGVMDYIIFHAYCMLQSDADCFELGMEMLFLRAYRKSCHVFANWLPIHAIKQHSSDIRLVFSPRECDGASSNHAI